MSVDQDEMSECSITSDVRSECAQIDIKPQTMKHESLLPEEEFKRTTMMD